MVDVVGWLCGSSLVFTCKFEVMAAQFLKMPVRAACTARDGGRYVLHTLASLGLKLQAASNHPHTR